MRRYLWNLLIAFDQLANALLAGDPDETISSRCGKRVLRGQRCWLCGPLCALLNKLDAGHCRDAIESDEGKPL